MGSLTPLPTTLQQRYNKLQEPQCTNLTYINTFINKMQSFDDEVENILCHLREAASKLDSIHVSPIKQRNHICTHIVFYMNIMIL